jgi:TRAP transporter TAXI family solute receptor
MRFFNERFYDEANIMSFQRLKQMVFFVSVCAVVLNFHIAFGAEDINLFRIGTGGKSGVYYPIGKIIAQGISNSSISNESNEGKSTSTYLSFAQNSGGSVDNVRGIIAGEVEAGLVQADVASWAFQTTHVFKENPEAQDIRAIASLYPEKFQIVIRRDAKVGNVGDLRGKHISVDEVGSGTLAVMRIVLDAHGLRETDLKPVYLKPIFTHDKIVSGELQGFVMMAGAPMEAVSQLLNNGITLVPIAPTIASQIKTKYPYLVPGKIAENIYPGIPETPTIQVHALLVVHKSMDDELVYKITAALWAKQTLSLLKAGHPQGKAIMPDTALAGISIPLHQGAKEYYQQHADRFNSSQLK